MAPTRHIVELRPAANELNPVALYQICVGQRKRNYPLAKCRVIAQFRKRIRSTNARVDGAGMNASQNARLHPGQGFQFIDAL